jgi:iron complex outermembrane receptor protein
MKTSYRIARLGTRPRVRACARAHLLAAIIGIATLASHSRAQEVAANKSTDFSNMSIEELMRVKLSLSRTDEQFSRSAAAAYIITEDEIRRSGVTSLPEALRMAPGIEVARVDSHTWAVTARGFNDAFANKLLVMIDGRTIYTPLFSGVFWDAQDTVLEDIDHIEIIRGPGSTLWGANAVNGVINIVTKKASQTQGGLIAVGAGTEERGFGVVRYGGKITEEAHYRAYVKYFNRDDTALANGRDAGDSWDMLRGGFRADWTPGMDAVTGSTHDVLTFQGDIYSGRIDGLFTTAVLTPPPRAVTVRDVQKAEGGNLLGRWTHPFSDEANIQLQAYYDRTHRDVVIFKEQRDTFDLDFQNRFRAGRRHDFVWGAGYRVTSDDTAPTTTVTLRPDSRTLNLFSMFVQDEIGLIEEKLRLTVGSKLEHNDLTGWEVQPGARLLWTPATNHTAWASVTRAVRTPSRAEEDIQINSVVTTGVVGSFFGNRGMESEKLVAYELGYRVQPITKVSLDLATFFNDYDDLRTLEFGPPPPTSAAAQYVRNRMHGETYGAELAANWQVTDWWRLRGSYTWFKMQLHRDANSNNPANEDPENESPHHQFMIRSSFDLPKNLELDCSWRYVDAILVPLPPTSKVGVPSYFQPRRAACVAAVAEL